MVGAEKCPQFYRKCVLDFLEDLACLPFLNSKNCNPAYIHECHQFYCLIERSKDNKFFLSHSNFFSFTEFLQIRHFTFGSGASIKRISLVISFYFLFSLHNFWNRNTTKLIHNSVAFFFIPFRYHNLRMALFEKT